MPEASLRAPWYPILLLEKLIFRIFNSLKCLNSLLNMLSLNSIVFCLIYIWHLSFSSRQCVQTNIDWIVSGEILDLFLKQISKLVRFWSRWRKFPKFAAYAMFESEKSDLSIDILSYVSSSTICKLFSKIHPFYYYTSNFKLMPRHPISLRISF